MDLTDLVVDAGVEQDPLGGRGLARVDVAMIPMLRTLARSIAALDTITPLLDLSDDGQVGMPQAYQR